MTKTCSFFDLPRELRDAIYEAACFNPPIAQVMSTHALKGIARGFMANKDLWREYEEMCRKNALTHHTLSLDLNSRPTPYLQILWPTMVGPTVVLLINLIIPLNETGIDYDDDADGLWPVLARKLKSYTDATTIAIDIHTNMEYDSPAGERFRQGMVNGLLFNLFTACSSLRQRNLKRFFLRLDEKYLQYSAGQMPASYVCFGNMSLQQGMVEPLRRFTKRMCLPFPENMTDPRQSE